jgi:hypothetical protein
MPGLTMTFLQRLGVIVGLVVGAASASAQTVGRELRPEVVATVVLRDARSFVVTIGAMRLSDRFEDHPITPSGECQ